MTHNCPNCKVELHEIGMIVEEAVRYDCPGCHYSKLEPSAQRIEPVREISPLQIKQKIIKLSQGRLGLYLSKDVVRSLGLKPGQDVFVSVPDGKHITVFISTI